MDTQNDKEREEERNEIFDAVEVIYNRDYNDPVNTDIFKDEDDYK